MSSYYIVLPPEKKKTPQSDSAKIMDGGDMNPGFLTHTGILILPAHIFSYIPIT